MSTPEASEMAEQVGPILVGVDGSESSNQALAWAAKQAHLSHLPLVAVTAWEWPATFGYPVAWPEAVDFEDDARKTLDVAVEKTLGADCGENVTRKLVRGHAALTLSEMTKDASLVVVGSRGHGEFSGMLLGSVSGFLASHSRCPVVIIRHDN